MKSTDFTDNTLNGYLTVYGNTVSLTKILTEDFISENTESFFLRFREDGPSGKIIGIGNTVTVIDSSVSFISPPSAYAVTRNDSVSLTFANGNITDTTLYYNISGSGITSSMFTDNSLSGSFPFTSTGIGTINKTLISGSLGISSGIIPLSYNYNIRLGSPVGVITATSSAVSVYSNRYNTGISTTFIKPSQSVQFNILTVGVANTTLYYGISGSGISSSIFTDNTLTGTVTVGNVISGISSGIITKTLVNNLTVAGTENFYIDVKTAGFDGPIVYTSSTISIQPPIPGQQAFTTPGTFSWTAPDGVTLVSVVCVGGGGGGSSSNGGGGAGGGGGGLGWKNNISVIPGQTYTVVVGSGGIRNADTVTVVGGNGGDSFFISTGTVAGFGGAGASSATVGGSGGSFFGDGGGNGGSSTTSSTSSASAGGGAGGYSGNGGSATPGTSGTSGSGSGGGGGAGGNGGSSDAAGAGGGVGLLGQGANGSGVTNSGGNGFPGFGGSGGANGSASPGSTLTPSTGGDFGGGGGGAELFNSATNAGEHGPGGGGAVRIMWLGGRSYPSNAANV